MGISEKRSVTERQVEEDMAPSEHREKKQAPGTFKTALHRLVHRHTPAAVKFNSPAHSRDPSRSHQGHSRQGSRSESHGVVAVHRAQSNVFGRKVADAVRMARRKKKQVVEANEDNPLEFLNEGPTVFQSNHNQAAHTTLWNNRNDWMETAPLEDLLFLLKGASTSPLPALTVTGVSRRSSNASEVFKALQSEHKHALLRRNNPRKNHERQPLSIFLSGVSATLYTVIIVAPLAIIRRVTSICSALLSPISSRIAPSPATESSTLRETLIVTRTRIATNMNWLGFLGSSALNVLKKMGPKKVAVAVGKEVVEKVGDGARTVAKTVSGRKGEKWVRRVGKMIGETPIEIHLFYGSLLAITVWRLKDWLAAPSAQAFQFMEPSPRDRDRRDDRSVRDPRDSRVPKPAEPKDDRNRGDRGDRRNGGPAGGPRDVPSRLPAEPRNRSLSPMATDRAPIGRDVVDRRREPEDFGRRDYARDADAQRGFPPLRPRDDFGDDLRRGPPLDRERPVDFAGPRDARERPAPGYGDRDRREGYPPVERDRFGGNGYVADRPVYGGPPPDRGYPPSRPFDRGYPPERPMGRGYEPERDFRGREDRGYAPVPAERFGPPSRGGVPDDRGFGPPGGDRAFEPRGYGGRGYDGGYGGREDSAYGPPRGGRFDDRGYGPPREGGPRGRFGGHPPGSEEDRRTSTQIFVGNLPYTYTEKDVWDMMERYGKLKKVTMPRDRDTGRNKGFAFADFEERRDAEDAFDKYNNYTLEGRRLRLDWDVGREKKGPARADTGIDSRGGDADASYGGPGVPGEADAGAPNGFDAGNAGSRSH
ncbi:hypothetical protein HDU93_008543 [Gonapodya sp. JEL0774]|nr:hypothetical protein HDU93_008543 [Gonapodya sp. JEL0774]